MSTGTTVALGLAVFAAFSGYTGLVYKFGKMEGVAETTATLQGEWATQSKKLVMAAQDAEARARTEEQRRTKEVAEAAQRGSDEIEKVRADAAIDRASRDRLQQRADAIATSLGSRTASLGACTAATGAAAAESARVLADVLKRADSRAGTLAAIADDAIERGNTCAAAYNTVRGTAP